ncbi:MAG: hypothetical protein P4L49_14310, partial [Desulfosporosinus sp.]|nr:hypothetical protein [Desulfosporosinus sp.]
IHRFEISNMIMPEFSVWKAEEMEGGYQFEILVKPEENQAVAIEHLHQKILTGLGYKTLKHLSDKYLIDNAIQIDKEQYSLNSVGTCQIQHVEEENQVYLVIDGKNIPLHDFGRALTTFEGFNMDFQMRDLSEEVLGKDTVLRRVSINPDVIIEHFEKSLSWFLEGDFLSYKHASACGEALFERIEQLELLCKYGNKEEAVAVGNKMKKRLISVEHDTEDFPDYLLNVLDCYSGTSLLQTKDGGQSWKSMINGKIEPLVTMGKMKESLDPELYTGNHHFDGADFVFLDGYWYDSETGQFGNKYVISYQQRVNDGVATNPSQPIIQVYNENRLPAVEGKAWVNYICPKDIGNMTYMDIDNYLSNLAVQFVSSRGIRGTLNLKTNQWSFNQ